MLTYIIGMDLNQAGGFLPPLRSSPLSDLQQNQLEWGHEKENDESIE